jgi:low affinity sulfate transporter 2
MKLATEEEEGSKGKRTIQVVILDMSSKCLRKNRGWVRVSYGLYQKFFLSDNFFFKIVFCVADLMNIDVSGITSLVELHKNLASSGMEVIQ